MTTAMTAKRAVVALHVALSAARGEAGPVTFSTRRRPTTSVVRAAGVDVHVINRRPSVATGAFVGALAGPAATFLAFFVICSNTRCLD